MKLKTCLFILLLSGLGWIYAIPVNSELKNEAGFMSIEPVDFYFHYGNTSTRLDLHSSEAKIWYSFLAADNDAENAPVFVFFNGGPGSGTSCGLMSMCTGKYTLDNSIDGGGDHYIENPYSWTVLGNLLYIDARQTGFSYNTMDISSNYYARFREFNAQNFNPFFDAADFIRVLLRFLAAHPSLQNNPVVIVGESYGGLRATAMLYLLLNYADLDDEKEMYQDAVLSREIRQHLETVFPDYTGRLVPSEVIARQFGHQVLIQPCVSFGYQTQIQNQMFRQPGSVIFRIGEEVGIPYNPNQNPITFVSTIANRDPYMYSKPYGWLTSFFNNAADLLRFTANLSLVTGIDVRSITEMYASARTRAYRILSTNTPASWDFPVARPDQNEFKEIAQALFLSPELLAQEANPVEPGDMEAVFGILQPWDRFFLSSNGMANGAFHFYNVALLRGYEVYYLDYRFGRMFLKNLLYVHTFITNASYDLVVYGPAIPESLKCHNDIVSSVSTIRDTNNPEWTRDIFVSYKNNPFPGISDPGQRKIHFPYFNHSCHAVSLTQPLELFSEVSAWLDEYGFSARKEVKR